jgi:hypothetical protein
VSGYREAAEALMRCRESLVTARSEWRWTLEHAHAPRMILRDTLTYGILVSRSLEPEQLQSAQRRRIELGIALGNALRGDGHRALPQAVVRTDFCRARRPRRFCARWANFHRSGSVKSMCRACCWLYLGSAAECECTAFRIVDRSSGVLRFICPTQLPQRTDTPQQQGRHSNEQFRTPAVRWSG